MESLDLLEENIQVIESNKKNSCATCLSICIISWFIFFIAFSIFVAISMEDEKHDCEQRNQEYDKHTCKFFNQTLSYHDKFINITYEVALLDSITNITFMYLTRCIINEKCTKLSLDGTHKCFVKKNNHIFLKFKPNDCSMGRWQTMGILWFILAMFCNVCCCNACIPCVNDMHRREIVR